jgi:tetratricopeptide (TPR) repeat protein
MHLLQQEDAGSPLFLTTACHSLIELGIYEEMDSEISKLPGRKIPLLADIIGALINDFGKGVIRSTLLFVYFSKGGVFEHELLHLVSQEVERMKRVEASASYRSRARDEAKKLDSFSFSLLYQRLKPLLPTTASGLLQFFHNDMRTLIFQLFLGGVGKDFSYLGEETQQKQFDLQTEEEQKESLRYNRILAEYYLKQVEEEGNHDLRTIQSLSTHMVKANMIDDLREILLLPRVFKAMFSSDLRIEFLGLWSKCLSSLASSAAVLLSPSGLRSADQDDVRIRKIFRDLDINGDGGISLREFRHFAWRLGIDRNAVDEFFNAINIDGSGLISLTEFLAFFSNKRQAMSKDEFDALLAKVDQGKVVSTSDMRGGSKQLAHSYREKLSSDANDIDDPTEEAQVFCLLGDFFQLKREEAQGLVLDSAESESFYKQALVLDPKSTSALIGLSRLARLQNELDRAHDHLREAMGYLQSSYGYKHIEVARCQRDMAEVCLMQNDLQTAKQAMMKARKIVTETCGKQSLEYSDFMMSEGDVLAYIANKSNDRIDSYQSKSTLWRDSVAAYREAIVQQKQVMGEKHPLVLMSYDRLINNVVEHPDMLTEDLVEEFCKPRVHMELSSSGTLQSASAFLWLQMLMQVHNAQQQASSDVVSNTDIDIRVASSLWYNDIDARSREPNTVEKQPVEMTEVVKASATLIKPAYDKSLALQMRAGTDTLELAEIDGSDNQLWLWHGEEVQHVATGLFLDAEVKYMYTAEQG